MIAWNPSTAHRRQGSGRVGRCHELYRLGDYDNAEKLFHDIADNKHNSPQVAEEARYYEAECLRRRDTYPKAGDVYHQLLTDFPSGMHRDQAIEREFEIANVWLDDTRQEMQAYRENGRARGSCRRRSCIRRRPSLCSMRKAGRWSCSIGSSWRSQRQTR